MIKRIGVLTSGGDCAGLNAVLRAIVHRAIKKYAWEVIGIHKGTAGFMSSPLDYEIMTLDRYDSSVLRTGGTMLGSTNKTDPFHIPTVQGQYEDRSQDFIEAYHQLNLDALIGIGGDGSMDILNRLAKKGGINLVTIPKTIDNDLGHTEIAIGYSTAVEVATEALDRLQPTAASHQRIMILEVMGRDAGHIALAAGIAGGADVILIPEISYTFDSICRKFARLEHEGRNFALIIVAEAVRDEKGQPVTLKDSDGRTRYGGIGYYLGESLEKLTQAECRVMVLGHVQRGGQPNAQDRLLASALGVTAVDLIAAKKFNRMVAWQNRDVIDIPIESAINHYQTVDPEGILVRTARSLDICFGDN